jgi:hypothetical protein
VQQRRHGRSAGDVTRWPAMRDAPLVAWWRDEIVFEANPEGTGTSSQCRQAVRHAPHRSHRRMPSRAGLTTARIYFWSDRTAPQIGRFP